MEYFTFVDFETARLVRKAYIDSLISSMIRLETDPHVVVWIDRLRSCRDRDWDEEVRDIIRNAISTYNTRWAVVYGGKLDVGKLVSKVARGVTAALTGKEATGTTGSLAAAVTKKVMGNNQTGGLVEAPEDDLQAALHAELQRINSVESMLSRHN